MKKNIKISVVSPIYNDAVSLKNSLVTLNTELKKLKLPYEILCIDDASSDDSLSIAHQCAKQIRALSVVSHPENKGIAHTYRELYRRSKGTFVVLFSLDGEWDPHDVVRLVRARQKADADVIIGCRTQKKYTVWRAFVSECYNQLMQLLFRVITRDAGSIKIFTRRVLELPIYSKGVFDEAERLIRASRQGYTIGYIPIKHYKKIKKIRGIKLSHVAEAIVDMVRVFWLMRSV